MPTVSLTEVERQLADMTSAANMYLMIIPKNVFFRHPIDEIKLEKLSCIYKLLSSDSDGSRDVTEVVRSCFLTSAPDDNSIVDLRIGIVYKRLDMTIGGLYFNDWQGQFDVTGTISKCRLLYNAKTPDLLRKIARTEYFSLVEGNGRLCA